MASDKKRKSGDAVAPVAKKAKTVSPAKSADRPAPLKSALKKTKIETTVVDEPKTKKSKTATEIVEKPKEKKSKAETVVGEKPKEKKPKASKKLAAEEPTPENDEDDAEGGAELTADQTAALLAGFSSDEDEEAEAEENGIEISKLPAAPKPSRSPQTPAADDPEITPGVIYIARLPHGFFEPQMRAYFSQFGGITHLRLARNRRTGRSKHFAFVEFASAAVADIVAKTMDKYLLFGHILQVRRVPAGQVREGMWKGPRGKVAPRNRLEGARLRKGADRETWGKRITREEGRRQEKAEKLREMGYAFDMPAVKSVAEVPVRELEEPEGVQLLIEGKKTQAEPGVEEKIEAVVEGGTITVTQERKVKRKSKDGGAAVETKTLTKKRKTKAV